jgi:hypothetical protein
VALALLARLWLLSRSGVVSSCREEAERWGSFGTVGVKALSPKWHRPGGAGEWWRYSPSTSRLSPHNSMSPTLPPNEGTLHDLKLPWANLYARGQTSTLFPVTFHIWEVSPLSIAPQEMGTEAHSLRDRWLPYRSCHQRGLAIIGSMGEAHIQRTDLVPAPKRASLEDRRVWGGR